MALVLKINSDGSLSELNISGSGGSSIRINSTTSVNMTMDDEDLILVTGSTPVTITLKDATLNDKPRKIKSLSTADVTIASQSGQQVENDIAVILPGGANMSISLDTQGGAWWIV